LAAEWWGSLEDGWQYDAVAVEAWRSLPAGRARN
jgi:hypothetical protein